MTPELRELCVNTIRFLAADAVQKANSGHPGTPMGLADIAFVLWNKFLRYNPQDPYWPNRDRVVLSAGHASMLLYAMLHLSGYDLPLEELRQFRQWSSRTPGHPEYGLTPGVECTTGPLGAGFGNAVGIALGLKMAASRFNSTEHAMVDACVYILCSDGDMQEGVCAESASLAGHLKLNNVIAVYDQNRITIGGEIDLSMSEDVGKRFEAYGWYVQYCDGHDHEELETCLRNAKDQCRHPSLIVAQTIIGKGAPTMAGTAATHGSPLGTEEVQRAKEVLGWPLEPLFYIPQEVRLVFAQRTDETRHLYQQWQEQHKQWERDHPDLAEQWRCHTEKQTPGNLLEMLIAAVEGVEGPTRKLSQNIIQEAARLIPQMTGGSGDLEPSTLTLIKAEASITPASLKSRHMPDPSFSGRNIHFGIREHGMGSVSNGLYLSGFWLPFCATFVVFSDYMRPSVRLAAISGLPTIFVYTHDSFWVGEDGPTHQPIEQAWALRVIPNLYVWRPADAVETAAAWAHALQRPGGNHPSALLLTRQGVRNLERPPGFNPKEIWKGGYIVREAVNAKPQVILISTGSEGGPVQEVRTHLVNKGISVRHVSMPCLELFKGQSKEYQNYLLPPTSKKIIIEAGVSGPWYQYADHVIGQESYGHSAPGEVIAEKFGFTAEHLTRKISNYLDPLI